MGISAPILFGRDGKDDEGASRMAKDPRDVEDDGKHREDLRVYRGDDDGKGSIANVCFAL